MTILSKYDRSTPVVTYDPNGTGYNRIVITRMMVYQIMVNQDDGNPCDFVDCVTDGVPESFTAIVL